MLVGTRPNLKLQKLSAETEISRHTRVTVNDCLLRFFLSPWLLITECCSLSVGMLHL